MVGEPSYRKATEHSLVNTNSPTALSWAVLLKIKKEKKMEKYLVLLTLVAGLSACTTGDTYWKTDVGENNIGTVFGTNNEKATDYCSYLFGLFKLSSDCSPDKIAKENNLKTITEVNTQNQLFPFVTVQRTTVSGIK